MVGWTRVRTGTTPTDFAPIKYDEWGIAWNRKFDHPLSTLDLHDKEQRPHRWRFPSDANTSGQVHSAGHGVGGAAQHYGGQMGRYSQLGVHDELVDVSAGTAQEYLEHGGPQPGRLRLPVRATTSSTPTTRTGRWPGGLRHQPRARSMPNSNFPIRPSVRRLRRPWTSSATAARPWATPRIPARHRLHPTLHEPVRGAGQRMRLRRLVRRRMQYVCETGAKANSAFRTIPAAIETGQSRPEGQQLHLQARHRTRPARSRT